MKSAALIILVTALFLTGCESAVLRGEQETAKQTVAAPQSQARSSITDEPRAGPQTDGLMNKVSLDDGAKADSAAAAFERKIIRDAQLNLEVRSPTETQRKVYSLAESSGGFVVTSEAKQREQGEPTNRVLDIKLVVRVPAAQFDQTVSAIEALATTVIQRNVTGQDVTEEFIDLEARIKTQKALELQFLEIMKRANKVEDALEVQRQIAEVRGEIEKLEGRKRFLDNRTSLSTITVVLQSPTPIQVATTGFGRNLREAVSDGLSMASSMFLFLIRSVIVMIPVAIFVLLPGWLAIRFLLRRARRFGMNQTLEPTPTQN